MTPSELIDKLNEELDNATDVEEEEACLNKIAGAVEMWDLYKNKEAEYRNANREKLRQYNREYQRARRAKQKEMEGEFDKIANMK